MYVTGPEGFGTGTYSIALSDDPRLRLLYYRAPDGIDYVADQTVAPNAMIIISQVGTGTIVGTFSGVVSAAGRPDIVITDGEFTVRRDHDLLGAC